MPKKKKRRKVTKHSLQSQTLNILRKNPKNSFNYKQISKQLGLGDESSKLLIQVVLKELEENEKIISVNRGKYKLKSQSSVVEGIVDITASGNAYVAIENLNDDIFVHGKYLPNIVSGDRVEVSVFSSFNSRRSEGEIIGIIERNTHQFVGKLEISKNFAFVSIKNPKIHFDIYINSKEITNHNLKNGQLVVCNIDDWGDKRNNPSGTIKEVLGYPGEHHAEIYSILAEHNIDKTFDKSIEEKAKSISQTITKEELKNRRDFRSITTFTIDPFDAKDFDDALSIQKLENGNYEIGIHIADVSHYVLENDSIDKEAQERATSVYLVDRVIPMLPEILSNNLCSLRPNEEKLCFSAVFEISIEGKIKNEWFGKTVILSDRRFNYEEAQERIETKEGDYSSELLILNNIAKLFRKERKNKGAISFHKVETKFKLDDDKNPISLFIKESKDAHKLIEEFMLLANRKVAEFIGKKSLPFVYRIHDTPNPEKLETLSFFLKSFGYKLQTENKNSIAQSMNKILMDVKGKDEASMIETLTIRTMAKAIYSTENIGHYGLAFNHYTHFTSPIRRYPDILIHRLLYHYLNNNSRVDKERIEKLCKHSSEMEIIASKAERDSIKYMQTVYISKFVGEKLEGIISGVTDFGIFVEVSNTNCEGLIRLKDIQSDFYTYDEQNYCIKGNQTNTVYRIGDKVNVKIRKVNIEKREINLILL
ncbi:MAG: ribonuclease R [Flavobacteriales bacterium]|nr:ribonuclease R [Flavobacteriales bacterium]